MAAVATANTNTSIKHTSIKLKDSSDSKRVLLSELPNHLEKLVSQNDSTTLNETLDQFKDNVNVNTLVTENGQRVTLIELAFLKGSTNCFEALIKAGATPVRSEVVTLAFLRDPDTKEKIDNYLSASVALGDADYCRALADDFLSASKGVLLRLKISKKKTYNFIMKKHREDIKKIREASNDELEKLEEYNQTFQETTFKHSYLDTILPKETPPQEGVETKEEPALDSVVQTEEGAKGRGKRKLKDDKHTYRTDLNTVNALRESVNCMDHMGLIKEIEETPDFILKLYNSLTDTEFAKVTRLMQVPFSNPKNGNQVNGLFVLAVKNQHQELKLVLENCRGKVDFTMRYIGSKQDGDLKTMTLAEAAELYGAKEALKVIQGEVELVGERPPQARVAKFVSVRFNGQEHPVVFAGLPKGARVDINATAIDSIRVVNELISVNECIADGVLKKASTVENLQLLHKQMLAIVGVNIFRTEGKEPHEYLAAALLESKSCPVEVAMYAVGQSLQTQNEEELEKSLVFMFRRIVRTKRFDFLEALLERYVAKDMSLPLLEAVGLKLPDFVVAIHQKWDKLPSKTGFNGDNWDLLKEYIQYCIQENNPKRLSNIQETYFERANLTALRRGQQLSRIRDINNCVDQVRQKAGKGGGGKAKSKKRTKAKVKTIAAMKVKSGDSFADVVKKILNRGSKANRRSHFENLQQATPNFLANLVTEQRDDKHIQLIKDVISFYKNSKMSIRVDKAIDACLQSESQNPNTLEFLLSEFKNIQAKNPDEEFEAMFFEEAILFERDDYAGIVLDNFPELLDEPELEGVLTAMQFAVGYGSEELWMQMHEHRQVNVLTIDDFVKIDSLNKDFDIEKRFLPYLERLSQSNDMRVLTQLKSLANDKEARWMVPRQEAYRLESLKQELDNKIAAINLHSTESHAAATTIQRLIRGHNVRKEARRIKEELAATKLQQHIRKQLQRSTIQKKKDARKNDASIRIQSSVRQFFSKQKVKTMKEGKAARRIKEELAATKLQQQIRVLLQRTTIQQMKDVRDNDASIRIQSQVRQFLTRVDIQKKKEAITKLQSFIRGHNAQKAARQLREDRTATKLQRQMRVFLQKDTIKQMKDARDKAASIRIQSQVRQFLSKKKVQAMQDEKFAATQIQTLARGFKARKTRQHLTRLHYAKVRQDNQRLTQELSAKDQEIKALKEQLLAAQAQKTSDYEVYAEKLARKTEELDEAKEYIQALAESNEKLIQELKVLTAAFEAQEKSAANGPETSEANDDLVIAIRSMQKQIEEMKKLHRKSIHVSKGKEAQAINDKRSMQGIVRSLQDNLHLSKQAFLRLGLGEITAIMISLSNDLLVVTQTFMPADVSVRLLNGAVIQQQAIIHRAHQAITAAHSLMQKANELWVQLNE